MSYSTLSNLPGTVFYHATCTTHATEVLIEYATCMWTPTFFLRTLFCTGALCGTAALVFAMTKGTFARKRQSIRNTV